MPITHTTPHHNFFGYAALYPTSDRFNLIENNPETDFIIDGQPVKARVIDYMEYTLDNISNFHSLLVYGIVGDELARQLKERNPKLTDKSRVVIYLFEKL